MTVSTEELLSIWWGLVGLLGIQVAFGQMRSKHLDTLHLQRRLQHLFSGLVVLYFQRVHSVDVIRLYLVSAIIFTVIAHKSRQYIPFAQRIFLRSFHSILRKPEAFSYQTPGAIHFLLGNLLSVAIYSPNFCSLVIIAISFGDPIAGIFGTLIPSRRIWGKKTLAGFLGCAVASGPVLVFAYESFTGAHNTAFVNLCLMVILGLAVALAELFVIVDDNISMPIGIGLIIRSLSFVDSYTPIGPVLYDIYTS